jgi:tripartite-type tricarboxylate transporter receptor subunit TctC
MLSQGNEIGGGAPEQFAALIAEEVKNTGEMVRAAGLKPE